MRIKELCEKAHQTAVDKGFWYVAQKSPTELLMLIVSELGEACEALRKNRRQLPTIQQANGEFKKEWTKDTFEDEIADAFIRLGDMCQALNIDIEWQIEKKMEYNKTRPYKHGKEF